MERLALDTTFLIDLQNERRSRGKGHRAKEFLLEHRDAELFLPVVALGEYLEGFDDPLSAAAQALVHPLRLLEVTADVAHLYAATARVLRATGRLVGANDLWIACTAKAARLPIVTRNAEHFSRVPDLRVIDYSR